MDICMEQVKKYHRQLSYIPDSFKTKELCRCAVENHGLALQYVPECFVTKELCDIAVKSNSVALSYVPDKFKSSEMIQTAFNNYSEARKHCISSDELDRDSNLLKVYRKDDKLIGKQKIYFSQFLDKRQNKRNLTKG